MIASPSLFDALKMDRDESATLFMPFSGVNRDGSARMALGANQPRRLRRKDKAAKIAALQKGFRLGAA
jgi:hypothetical protein